MHLLLQTAASLGLLGAGAPNPPFDLAPVADAELAATAGTGDPRGRARYRMTDAVAAAAERQTAAIGATIKDLWLIDVASPLIAANVRAAAPR